MPRIMAWKNVMGFPLVFGLWSYVVGLWISISFQARSYSKTKDHCYSLKELLVAIQSYIKVGMIIPSRTILASCQGNAHDFVRFSIARTIIFTASSSSIKKGISAWRPAVKGVFMKPG